MTRFLFLFAALALACAPLQAAPCAPSHYPKQTELKRGINLSGWWQGEKNKTPDPENIRKLGQSGFDFVRLPLAPEYLEDTDAETQARLRCDISLLLESGLNLVIDLHGSKRLKRQVASGTLDEALGRLMPFFGHLASALEGLPPQHIAISLFNEPHMEDKEGWWHLQGALIKKLRPLFPHNRLIATASPDGGSWDLAAMKPYAEKNILYDFHFYTPMVFTHYGAHWIPGAPLHRKQGGILYPAQKGDGETPEDIRQYNADGWNRKKLQGEMEKIIAWKKRHHAQIACLEFGVYQPFTDPGSNARWLGDVRGLLENAHIPWAVWEYWGGFGLISKEGEMDEKIAKALGFHHNHAGPEQRSEKP